MTREQTKVAAEVMLAFANGETVECRRVGDIGEGFWNYTGCPNWDWIVMNYRVKPKPREFWIVFDRNGHTSVFFREPTCPTMHGESWIKVREV